jgi:flavorubredoxin
MVHWPESMATYIPEEKILFSMDAFGQHYASSHRFDDEEPLDVVMAEAKTYFANIVMLYGRPIGRVLERAGDIELEIVAPSHGVIWRKHIDAVMSAYRRWVRHFPEAKILVVYDTMWKSTETMARAILQGATQGDVETKLLNVRVNTLTELATETLDAAAIAVGSPTLNKTLMPQVAAALTYLKGLAPANKSGFAFGSYGWARGGAQAVEEYLKAMKFEILREPLQVRYVPGPEDLAACRAAGALLAEAALKAVAAAGED